MADGPVLPLQFGYTAADDLAVRQALESNAESYLSALDRLNGCAEYHVRASQADQTPLLHQILGDLPEARTSTTGSAAGIRTRGCRWPWEN